MQVVQCPDAIDAGAVKRYAAKVMRAGTPAIAAVGPIGRLENHATFARRFGAAPLDSKSLADAAE